MSTTQPSIHYEALEQKLELPFWYLIPGALFALSIPAYVSVDRSRITVASIIVSFISSLLPIVTIVGLVLYTKANKNAYRACLRNFAQSNG